MQPYEFFTNSYDVEQYKRHCQFHCLRDFSVKKLNNATLQHIKAEKKFIFLRSSLYLVKRTLKRVSAINSHFLQFVVCVFLPNTTKKNKFFNKFHECFSGSFRINPQGCHNSQCVVNRIHQVCIYFSTNIKSSY